MRLVEFHVANSGEPIAINPENVCRIEMAKDGAFIRQVDGSSVDVREDYATVKRMLESAE